MNFLNYKSIYYYLENFKYKESQSIACFDLDYTLIKPKSGKKFPINHNDWEILFDNVPTYLKALVKNKYSIIIFTNQKGISKNKITIEQLNEKLNNIQKKLNIPINFIISTTDDKFRKPMTGMFDFFLEKSNIIVDYNNSFYVGDAAGRIYKKRKDHSSDDINFAYNIKLKFFTPEIFFNKIDEEHTSINLNLKSYSKDSFEIPTDKNIILLVGPPASGKSFLSKSKFNNYKIINQDTLKSKKKCLDKTIQYFKKNHNVIIDNTNSKKDTRKEFLDLASKYNCNKYLININIPKDVVKYLNMYRTQTSNVKLIPDVVYNIFYKNYEIPTIDEGNIINYKNYFIDSQYKF